MYNLSIVIVWCNRPELAETLQRNREIFHRHAREILFVNCGGNEEQLHCIIAPQPSPKYRHIYIPTIHFNKSLAMNVGCHCSTSDFVFLLDSDIVLTSDFINGSMSLLQTSQYYVKIKKVFESRPTLHKHLRFLAEEVVTREVSSIDGRRAVLHFSNGGDGSRCGAGLLLLKKDHLVSIGGFNSCLTGWGFEDLDLQIRLQFLLQVKPAVLGEVLHLTHGDEHRYIIGPSKDDNFRTNMRQCFERYSDGNLIGTYDRDLNEWQARI